MNENSLLAPPWNDLHAAHFNRHFARIEAELHAEAREWLAAQCQDNRSEAFARWIDYCADLGPITVPQWVGRIERAQTELWAETIARLWARAVDQERNEYVTDA